MPVKKIWLALLLVMQVLRPAAQPQGNTDSLYHKVRGFGIGLPQEKVYLHMDNTCYFLGDTIWYKGYVVRAGDQHTLTDLSRILYVELLTPDGYLVERQQLEMPGGTAHGAFVLTDSLYAGYYELRAYTRWMLNFGQCEYPHIPFTEKAFYSKRMAKEFFRDYDKLYSRVFPVYDKPEVPGRYAKDMTVRPLRRYFKKQKKKKPELQPGFYPEGGHLVQGTDCRVALELNDEEGRHLANTDIAIVDKDGNEVAECRTDERGRAAFTLYNIDEKGGYRASFSFDGYEYEENLPEVEKTGCALAVTLTDTTGRKTDFSHVVLIMTSNAGAFEMSAASMGFATPAAVRTDGPDAEDGKGRTSEAAARKGRKALEQLFTPEFRNRLDALVPFGSLTQPMMLRIVDKFVEEVAQSLTERHVHLTLDEEARRHLAQKGFDPRMGARPLRRLLRDELEDPLAQELLFGRLQKGGEAVLVLRDGKLHLDISRKGPACAEAAAAGGEARKTPRPRPSTRRTKRDGHE